jgi:penicillin-binding protein 1A
VRRYTEYYDYDAVGNLLELTHAPDGGARNNPSWRRRYQYQAGSNRLRATSAPGDGSTGTLSDTYVHDANGNMTKMVHLQRIEWSYRDQVREVDLGGGGTGYYAYDGEGQRVRKVVELRGGIIRERIYLGDYEIYRERRGNRVSDASRTLHVQADGKRVALVDTLKQYGRSRNFNNGALVSMETDGAVRAMVGGKDYGESQFNRASHAYRQPGSSFKSYVYLTALQNGFTPNSVLSDGYVSCGRWSPKNYSGGFRGRMTLRMALAKSINTIAVKLSLQAGREKVLADLAKMGITHLKKTCSLALGDNGMTPLEHTGGYAVFAAGGLEVRPYAIEEIRTLPGELLYNHERDEPPRKQIFERKVIEQLNTMLQAVVTEGTGKAAKLDYTHSAGKTGTSSAYRDAWFIGFTGQYVTGVWIGNDDFTPMSRVTGGSYPAQTWGTYMKAAHDTDNIPTIPGLEPHPVQVAESARLAAARAQTASTETPVVAPPPESVKDMTTATRKILETLSGLLKDARTLSPSDQRPDRAEAPAPKPRAEAAPKASLVFTAPVAEADAEPLPQAGAQSAQSAAPGDNAPVPQ